VSGRWLCQDLPTPPRLPAGLLLDVVVYPFPGY
jgi:hypothetical protein